MRTPLDPVAEVDPNGRDEGARPLAHESTS